MVFVVYRIGMNYLKSRTSVSW